MLSESSKYKCTVTQIGYDNVSIILYREASMYNTFIEAREFILQINLDALATLGSAKHKVQNLDSADTSKSITYSEYSIRANEINIS